MRAIGPSFFERAMDGGYLYVVAAVCETDHRTGVEAKKRDNEK